MTTVMERLARVATAMSHGLLRRRFRELSRRAALLGLAFVLALGGLGFLSYACFTMLALELGAWPAALIVGLVLLLIASALVMVARREVDQHPAQDERTASRTAIDPASELGDTVGRLLTRSDGRTHDMLLASLVAGIVCGASPRLRGRVPGSERRRAGADRANDEFEAKASAGNARGRSAFHR